MKSYQNHNQKLQQASGSSRFGGGEIVEVEGGHIVRSTGRKDRHSKVCTSKGPRDRRVRLLAHTAIQFYDVQDRLGYDRPSKAVDWLIKKAKTAIDKLAEIPAWKPTATTVTRSTRNPNSTSVPKFDQNPHQSNCFEQHPDVRIAVNALGSSQNSTFLPPYLDSDSIADTIKSFFPTVGSSIPANNSHNASSGMHFPPLDLLSRTSNRNQDLRLSLQTQQANNNNSSNNNNNNGNICFDGSGWLDNPGGGFQRTVSFDGDAVSAGFIFSSQPLSATSSFSQPLLGQTITNGLFNDNSRREPLQSSITPSFRAWIDPLSPFTGVAIDQHSALAAGFGGFSGFRVPARIQGEQEERLFDRPSSASSDSRH